MIDTRIELVGKLNNTTRLIEPITEELEIIPSKEQQIVTPKEGIHGFNKVTIDKIPSEYIKPGGTIELNANGEYDVKSYEKAKVNVGGLVINDASYLFYQGSKLDIMSELISLISPNCINFKYMFGQCKTITGIPMIDTSNGTDLSYMFYQCNAITEIPQIDTSKCTDFSYMFYYCSKLESIPLLNTSNGTNFSNMFYQCYALTEIPPIDTSKNTNCSNMFSYCQNLETIPLLDLSKTTLVNGMFSYATKLKNLGGFKDYGKGLSTGHSTNQFTLDLSPCTLLTHESLMNVINNLYDLASAGIKPQKLKLSSKSLNLLSEEEKNVGINKGWNIST